MAHDVASSFALLCTPASGDSVKGLTWASLTQTTKVMLNRPTQGNVSENFSGPVKWSCLEFHSENVDRIFPPGLPYTLQAIMPTFLEPVNLDFHIPRPVGTSKTQRGVSCPPHTS